MNTLFFLLVGAFNEYDEQSRYLKRLSKGVYTLANCKRLNIDGKFVCCRTSAAISPLFVFEYVLFFCVSGRIYNMCVYRRSADELLQCEIIISTCWCAYLQIDRKLSCAGAATITHIRTLRSFFSLALPSYHHRAIMYHNTLLCVCLCANIKEKWPVLCVPIHSPMKQFARRNSIFI